VQVTKFLTHAIAYLLITRTFFFSQKSDPRKAPWNCNSQKFIPRISLSFQFRKVYSVSKWFSIFSPTAPQLCEEFRSCEEAEKDIFF